MNVRKSYCVLVGRGLAVIGLLTLLIVAYLQNKPAKRPPLKSDLEMCLLAPNDLRLSWSDKNNNGFPIVPAKEEWDVAEYETTNLVYTAQQWKVNLTEKTFIVYLSQNNQGIPIEYTTGHFVVRGGQQWQAVVDANRVQVILRD